MPIIVESNRSNADLFLSVTGADSRTSSATSRSSSGSLAESPDEYAIVLGSRRRPRGRRRARRHPPGHPAGGQRHPDAPPGGHQRARRGAALRHARGRRGARPDRARRGGQARPAGLAGAQRLPGHARPTAPAASQVTVFSPKGGVGKTTIAVNLALALTDSGNQTVCLVDLDLAFGDVAITLQLFPARTIADAVHLESDLDFHVLEPLLTRTATGSPRWSRRCSPTPRTPSRRRWSAGS